MDAATARFVDCMGEVFASEGFPLIAGRLFGLLLVSEWALSLDQLTEELQMSKASASTNARLLANIGLLQRVNRPADRHDYYQPVPDLFPRTMAHRLQRWQRFAAMLSEARRSLPLRSASVRARLRECEAAYAYMADAISGALTRWERHPRLQSAGKAGSRR